MAATAHFSKIGWVVGDTRGNVHLFSPLDGGEMTEDGEGTQVYYYSAHHDVLPQPLGGLDLDNPKLLAAPWLHDSSLAPPHLTVAYGGGKVTGVTVTEDYLDYFGSGDLALTGASVKVAPAGHQHVPYVGREAFVIDQYGLRGTAVKSRTLGAALAEASMVLSEDKFQCVFTMKNVTRKLRTLVKDAWTDTTAFNSGFGVLGLRRLQLDSYGLYDSLGRDLTEEEWATALATFEGSVGEYTDQAWPAFDYQNPRQTLSLIHI